MTTATVERGAAQVAAMRVLARKRADAAMPRDERFFTELLAGSFYDKQIEMARSIDQNRRTAVVGCNSSGKDYMSGRIVLYWMKTRSPAKVVIIGPSHRQVKEIVWRETRSAYASATRALGGTMRPIEPYWELDNESHAIGFATSDDMNIHGFHSPHLLVILTEAHAIEQTMVDAVKRLNPERILMTGNALSVGGEFYDAFHTKQDIWNGIRISAFDTPNLRDDCPDVPGMITLADIEERKAEWGEDNPLYEASVLAKFPRQTPGQLISLDWVEAAKKRESDATGAIDVGIDVAGPGEDETVCYAVRGPRIVALEAWRDADPRGAVVAFIHGLGGNVARIKVDAVGMGWYFFQHLAGEFGEKVYPVNVGEAVPDDENLSQVRFANVKARNYWGLRQRFAAGEIAGVTDDITAAQLVSIKYDHDPRGRVRIERKEDALKRGVRSPDRAEALMLAYAPVIEWEDEVYVDEDDRKEISPF